MSVRIPHPRHRRTRLAAGACAVLAVATLATGCDAASASADKHPDHRSFQVRGKALTIDSDDSALELVQGGDGDQVHVTRWLTGGLGGSAHASWKMTGDRLTLHMTCGSDLGTCGAKHRLEIPSGMAVTILDHHGDVTARDMHNALKIQSDHGSLDLSGITGSLQAHATNGSVDASRLSSSQVEVSTEDGSAELGLAIVPDRVAVTSEDGSITISLPHSGPDGSSVAYHVITAQPNDDDDDADDDDDDDGDAQVDVARDTHSPHLVSATAEDGSIAIRDAN